MPELDMRTAVLRAEPELPIAAIRHVQTHVPAVIGHLLDVKVRAIGNDLVNRAIGIASDFHSVCHFLTIWAAHAGKRLIVELMQKTDWRGLHLPQPERTTASTIAICKGVQGFVVDMALPRVV